MAPILWFIGVLKEPGVRLVIGAFAIFSTSSNLVVQSLLLERGGYAGSLSNGLLLRSFR